MTVVGDAKRAAAGPDATAAALLDALPDATAVLDPHGVIVSVNRAWRTLCLENGGEPERSTVGVNYLDVCLRSAAAGLEDAKTVVAGLRAVLAGEAVERVLDYECSSPKVVRWYMLRITPVDHPGLGAMVTHTNITRRKAFTVGSVSTASEGGRARKSGVVGASNGTSAAGWRRRSCGTRRAARPSARRSAPRRNG